MNTPNPIEYLPLPVGSSNNFAEIYDKRFDGLISEHIHICTLNLIKLIIRLLQPFTCPYNGERNDSCECSVVEIPRAGLTRFSKVRVDLANMKIIGDSSINFTQLIAH